MDDDNTKHMDSATDAVEGDPPAQDDTPELDQMLSQKMLEMWPLTEKEKEINRAFWASTDPDDVALRETMKRDGRTPYPLRAGMQYILNEEGTPVDCPNILKWGRWMEAGNRVVKQTEIGRYHVSTVFLGIDHSFGLKRMLARGQEQGELPSLVLWETMIFVTDHTEDEPDMSQMNLPKDLSFWQERHTSRAEAMAGHVRAVDACLAQFAQ